MPDLPKNVEIVNPAPNGRRYTNRKCALRYIEQGRAEPVGTKAIRFLSTDYRVLATARSASTHCGYDRAVTGERATQRELRGLPMVGDVSKLERAA